MDKKILIFVPTYNENENANSMVEALSALNLPNTDMLFIDDNSPDGTGSLLENLKNKYANLIVNHREGKLGIGSAHLEGIRWAYDQKYDLLITLDCDFTHPPSLIPKMIEHSKLSDIVTTSRYIDKNSLANWNLYRKTLTLTGHFLTRLFLKMKFDATGAFRVYSLTSIDKRIFSLVKSTGYSFFFESLFILNINKYSIAEIPISLFPRTYGHSKMRYSDAWKSLKLLFKMFFNLLVNPKLFKL